MLIKKAIRSYFLADEDVKALKETQKQIDRHLTQQKAEAKKESNKEEQRELRKKQSRIYDMLESLSITKLYRQVNASVD